MTKLKDQPKKTVPKAGAQNRDVQDIKHEEVPAVVILSLDEKVNLEVAKFDIAEAWINGKKDEFKDLKIKDIDDKDGYKQVEEAYKLMKSKRIGVEKRHTDLKAESLAIGRGLDAAKNKYTKLLREGLGGEDALGAELDRIDNLKKEEKEKADREAQQRLQGRVAELIENGIAFTGSYYTIGETISMDVVTLKDMKDADYATFLDRVKTENAAIVEAKRLKDEEDQKEKDRLEKQKKDQEEAQKKLDDDRKAIEKERREGREEKMGLLGYVQDQHEHWIYTNGESTARMVFITDLGQMEQADWIEKLEMAKTFIKNADQKEATRLEEKQAADKLNARLLKIAGLGMRETSPGTFTYTAKNQKIVVTATKEATGALSDTEFETALGTYQDKIREYNEALDRMIQKVNSRILTLVKLGMQEKEARFVYQGADRLVGIMEKEFIGTATDADFDKQVQQITQNIEQYKTRLERRKELEAIGFQLYGPDSDNPVFQFGPEDTESLDFHEVLLEELDQPADEWEETIEEAKRRVTEIKQAEAKRKEDERLEALSELDRFREWIAKLKAVEPPVFENEDLKNTVNHIQASIDGTLQKIENVLGK